MTGYRGGGSLYRPESHLLTDGRRDGVNRIPSERSRMGRGGWRDAMYNFPEAHDGYDDPDLPRYEATDPHPLVNNQGNTIETVPGYPQDRTSRQSSGLSWITGYNGRVPENAR